MKRVFFLIFNLTLILVMSCEKGFFVNCNECDSSEPYDTELTADIDVNSQNGVIVHVWEGKLEDGLLIDSAQIFSSSTFRKTVPLNRNYTLTATYLINDKTYVVVNSTMPKVRYASSQCDDACYYVYDNDVNLRLKYTK